MGKCKKCGTELEWGFDSCWNCGTGQDGATSPNPQEYQAMKQDAAHYKTTDSYVSSYDTTRTIATVVSFIGWFVVVISAVSVLVCLRQKSGMWGLMPALGGTITGLLLVMTGQLTRAMVDTADHTGQMLFLMKKKNRE